MNLNVKHLTPEDLKLKVSSNIFSGNGTDIYKLIETIGADVLKDPNNETKEVCKGLSIECDDDTHELIKKLCNHYNSIHSSQQQLRSHPKRGNNETIVMVVNKKVLTNKKYFHNFGSNGTHFHFGRYYENM